MISSTTLDLPEHRKQAELACEAQGFSPLMMEQLGADRASGLTRSLEMVDSCEVYLLILGARYGEVPDGSAISITEAEYERAMARDIPLLTFVAGEDHPFPLGHVETGAGAEKLARFRERVRKTHSVNFFTNVDEFRDCIINSLTQLRDSWRVSDFHYVVEIPAAPAKYAAHPYSLLESQCVVGRSAELEQLDQWIRNESSDAGVTVITAVGGMGKSALTWKWFSEMPPEDAARFAGRMWWSFYESDATYENFTARALAYVMAMPLDEALTVPVARREQRLLEAFRTRPFLLCLDGVERILVAYARLDPQRVDEDELENVKESEATRLRRTANPDVGKFLRKLRRDSASRVLITSRLYPSDLESPAGLLPGCQDIKLGGLTDEDGIELWRELGITGDDEALLDAVRAVQSYPLLMSVLAGQIANFPAAPGDYAKWRQNNPSFDPFAVHLKEVRDKVLRQALADLPPEAHLVLMILAAFRMPVAYDILQPLCVGGAGVFALDSELFDALAELRGRGLIGWDRPANRYDLHPVVRRIVWNGLQEPGREIVFEMLESYFDASPMVSAVGASSADALTPVEMLYSTRLSLGRHAEAFALFRDRIMEPLVHRMNHYRLGVQLLEPLFPDGIANAPRLADPEDAHTATWVLAYAYDYMGEPSRAIDVWRRLAGVPGLHRTSAMFNYATSLWTVGRLREAEKVLEECVQVARSPDKRSYAVYRAALGYLASTRGADDRADELLLDAFNAFGQSRPINQPSDASPLLERAWHLLKQKRTGEADALARRVLGTETDVAQVHLDALHLQGCVLMEEGRYDEAQKSLAKALSIACSLGSEVETGVTIRLAELYARLGWLDEARELLEDVWEPLERGPLRIWHADARNTLAEIELAAGRKTEAVEAAREAYRLAWCDAPPYAYAKGLECAWAVLAACNAPKPLVIVEDSP
ncbi:MAG TPA: tetratricopeptide repeat protein [Thermoanaerobaculia bacterium]|nr:tetratricopeptide repeat protein [Thermoanaerobaculia bacterium]